MILYPQVQKKPFRQFPSHLAGTIRKKSSFTKPWFLGAFFLCVDGIIHISTKKKRKNTLFALFSHLILYLVGGFNHLEKYELVSWDYDIPNWMESHKIPWFQSPPTRYSTSWKTVSHSYGLDDPQPGDYPYLNCPMIIP